MKITVKWVKLIGLDESFSRKNVHAFESPLQQQSFCFAFKWCCNSVLQCWFRAHRGEMVSSKNMHCTKSDELLSVWCWTHIIKSFYGQNCLSLKNIVWKTWFRWVFISSKQFLRQSINHFALQKASEMFSFWYLAPVRGFSNEEEDEEEKCKKQ